MGLSLWLVLYLYLYPFYMTPLWLGLGARSDVSVIDISRDSDEFWSTDNNNTMNITYLSINN